MRVTRTVLGMLLLVALATGCRKPGEKPEPKEPVFPSPVAEDLEGVYAYAVGRDGFAAVDLYKEEMAGQSRTASAVGSACLSSDGAILYLGVENGVAVVDLVKGRIGQPVSLGAAPRILLPNPRTNEAFSIDSQKRLSVIGPSGVVMSVETAGIPAAALVTPDGSRIVLSISAPPTSFVEVVDWLMKNVVRTIDVPNVTEVAVAPFGVRIYLLSESSCHVYDGRSYERICRIDFPSAANQMRMTPAGNKIYFLSGSRMYVVSRAKNAIVSTISFPGELVDVDFSPDGGWAYALARNPGGFFILDAGMDSVIFSVQLASIPGGLALSPQGSRVYVLAGSDSLLTFDVGKRQFTKSTVLGIDAFSILVNKTRISMEKEAVKGPDVGAPPETISEGVRQGFTIQVSSSSDISSAEALAGRLRKAGYPAYVSASETPDGVMWYRVRAGFFDEREDAVVVAGAISSLQEMKSWVTAASMDASLLPELPAAGRDMDSDGKPEAVYRTDSRTIVVFKIERGIYHRVHRIEKESDTYLGESRMSDADGDGDEEAVTGLLEEGKVSIIDFVNGAYEEKIASR